jgi:hypothetical protein
MGEGFGKTYYQGAKRELMMFHSFLDKLTREEKAGAFSQKEVAVKAD